MFAILVKPEQIKLLEMMYYLYNSFSFQLFLFNCIHQHTMFFYLIISIYFTISGESKKKYQFCFEIGCKQYYIFILEKYSKGSATTILEQGGN